MWPPAISSPHRLRKEPRDVQKEKQAQEAEANRLRRKEQEETNDAKTKMKGKNRPSKRHRKKQTNVIEEKRPEVLKRLREEVSAPPFPNRGTDMYISIYLVRIRLDD